MKGTLAPLHISSVISEHDEQIRISIQVEAQVGEKFSRIFFDFCLGTWFRNPKSSTSISVHIPT